MIAPLLSALSFLTRIPVPARIHTDTNALRRAPAWFPAVGLLLGVVDWALASFLLRYFAPFVTAVLLLIAGALLTGALHLDGLADMADGFGGGRTRDDVLRIMRDHVIGSYGATALILVLILKTASLSEIVQHPRALPALVVAPAFARWSILFLSRLAPYARTNDSGGSGALALSMTKTTFLIGSLVPMLLLITLRPAAALLLPTVIVQTWLVRRYARKRIGGITGDVLGANVTVAEAVQYITALLLPL